MLRFLVCLALLASAVQGQDSDGARTCREPSRFGQPRGCAPAAHRAASCDVACSGGSAAAAAAVPADLAAAHLTPHSPLSQPSPPTPGPHATAATALLSLRNATANWDAATAALNGSAWEAGTAPCGGGGVPPWKGVVCSTGGVVTQLALANLSLAGSLPAQLANLPSLLLLDLSGNAYEGGIPAAWLAPGAFPSLADADLGRNKLAGGWVDVVLHAPACVRASAGMRAAGCARMHESNAAGYQRGLASGTHQSCYRSPRRRGSAGAPPPGQHPHQRRWQCPGQRLAAGGVGQRQPAAAGHQQE